MAIKVHEGPHKFERIKTAKGKYLYKCMLIACPTYYSLPELVLGQQTLCWSCNSKFPMNSYHLKLRRPMCDKCRYEREQRRRAS